MKKAVIMAIILAFTLSVCCKQDVFALTVDLQSETNNNNQFNAEVLSDHLQTENDENDREFLLGTGMRQEEVDAIDEDIRAYIVRDLRRNTNGDVESIDVVLENTYQPYSIEILKGIKYSASAYKNGATIYIYPVYKFTTYKKPVGGDYFGVSLGSAFSASSFGGSTWYKTRHMTNMVLNKTELVPPNFGESWAVYSGSALGDASEEILVKGCTSCKATKGEGSSKKVFMTYAYNPNKYSCSYSISNIAGVSFTSPNKIYTSTGKATLSY